MARYLMTNLDHASSQLLRHFMVPAVVFALASSLALSLHSSTAPGQSRTRVDWSSRESLTIEERISYQRTIEEVYWRHRIWPKDNPKAKPTLDQVVPRSVLRGKVEDYVQKSRALALHRPITREDLQSEMERMARQTKQPEILKELWAALGNDPYVIAECLARPALAEEFMSESHAPEKRHFRASKGPFDVGLFRRGRETDARARLELVSARELSSLLDGTNRFYMAAVLDRENGQLNIANVKQVDQPFDIQRKDGSQPQGEIEMPKCEYQLPVIASLPGCAEDVWAAPTSTTNAPSARTAHTAVWTGSEMIIWGGYDGSNFADNFDSGGQYDPATDRWRATGTTNAPSARRGHTAIWTGSEMIIWGGYNGVDDLNTGGRYNPATNSWTATSMMNVPSERGAHTAVWTGSEMIVYGGSSGGFLNTGGRYDPATDSWKATSTANARARNIHTAVWTGSEMIVWGGIDEPLSTGDRYDPATDSWRAISTTNAPNAFVGHTAVWTGSEMIVWGGFRFPNSFNTGGRYNPAADTWIPTATASVPSARAYHTAVWTGSEMLVWGATTPSSGGRYDPATDSWRPTTLANAPNPRAGHTAIWTGSEVIVWGGGNASRVLDTGGRYCGFRQQLFFPQLAFGGGFSTTIQLVNTGAQSATAAVKIVDSSGAAVSLPPNVLPASGSLSIPSGGMATLPITGTNGLTTAWGLVESSVNLTGVAIYQSSVAGIPSTLVGVEGTQPIREAIIPVNNNGAEDRYTGVAIANHSQEDLNIRLVIVNENGATVNTIAPPELYPLKPQKQVVRFLHELSPALSTFRGSVVLTAGGKNFIVLALIQAQGHLTAIPVLSRP